MKTVICLLLACSVFATAGLAQEKTKPKKAAKAVKTVAPVTNKVELATPPVTSGSVSMKAMQSLEQNKPVSVPPNEIRTDKGVYSGVLPQVVKADNPLQLINPAAPKEYGDSSQNTVYDPKTGQAQGIKLFSFSWFSKDKKKVRKVSTPAPEK